MDFNIYPHRFWLAAFYTIHCQTSSVICAITNYSRYFNITKNGLIQDENKLLHFLLVFDLNYVQPV